MVKGVLCSTGAIITRYNGRNPFLIPELAPKIECDGFEIMIYPAWYEEEKEITSFLRKSRICFPVLHADKQIGELISRNQEGDIFEAARRFDVNCRMATELGCERMALHLWGGPPSDKNISLNYEMCGIFLNIANAKGIDLCIENVICAELNPLFHMNKLMGLYPDIHFTFDTKMAEFHSEMKDTLNCTELWAENHIRHLHVNDYGGGHRQITDLRVLHIGEGHVDFEAFFSHVKNVDYNGYATVESSSTLPDGSIAFDKLNRSLLIVKKRFNI